MNHRHAVEHLVGQQLRGVIHVGFCGDERIVEIDVGFRCPRWIAPSPEAPAPAPPAPPDVPPAPAPELPANAPPLLREFPTPRRCSRRAECRQLRCAEYPSARWAGCSARSPGRDCFRARDRLRPADADRACRRESANRGARSCPGWAAARSCRDTHRRDSAKRAATR